MDARFSIGFDFGTESVRALIVNVRDGRIASQAAENYPHGVIDHHLPAAGGAPGSVEATQADFAAACIRCVPSSEILGQ